MTDGFEVLVHEVIAAIATAPSRIVVPPTVALCAFDPARSA